MQDNTTPNDREQQNNSEPLDTSPLSPAVEVQPSIQPEIAPPTTENTTVPATVTPASEANITTPNQPEVTAQETNTTVPPMQPSLSPTVTAIDSASRTSSMPQVPNKKSTKKVVLVIVAVLAILLASVAGVLAYLSTVPTPEERLQSAIVLSAETQSLQQEYSVEGSVDGSELKGNITMQNDFSDPATPKSTGNFDIDVSFFGIAIQVKSDFICVSETECFIKYNEFTIPEELSTEKPAFLSQWLKFNPYDGTAETADPFQLITGLNTVLGEVITGNITGNAKDEITKYATNGTTYTFSSSNEEELAGKSTIKYDLSLNLNEIIDLNKTVATQYNIQNPFEKESDITQRSSAWVDKDSGRIIKVALEEDGVKSTVTFSKFDEKPEIKAPDTYLNPDEYNEIL